MAETAAVTRNPLRPWATALIVGGAAITLASATAGVVWLDRMPDLQAVEFGGQVQITATRSTTATIYASTGLARAPSCEAASQDGTAVPVGEAGRYLQEAGLESALGFAVVSGRTYTVTCTGATEAGRFAVAQDAAVSEDAFMAAGLMGLVVGAAGVVLAARPRR